MIGRKGRRYTCCGRRAGARGCTARWTCCDKQEHEAGCANRYTCCERDVDDRGCQRLHPCCGSLEDNDDASGCREVCVRCGREWGTAAAECFRRAHNVTELPIEERTQTSGDDDNSEEERVVKTAFGMPPVVMLKPY